MNIKELSQSTGLSVAYIRKCLNMMHPLFDPHVTKGRYNRIEISDEGVVLMGHVKELKAQDLTVTEIAGRLGVDVDSSENHQEIIQTTQKSSNSHREDIIQSTPPWVEKISELERELRHEKDKFTLYVQETEETRQKHDATHVIEIQHREKQIQELTIDNASLKQSLKMLPASPEEITRSHLRRQVVQETITRLFEELETLHFWQSGRRKRLIAQIRELQDQK